VNRSVTEMLEEVLDVSTGLGVMLLPMLTLAVPGILLVVVPALVLMLPLALVAAVLALPFLLFRKRA
jgi:hypothetical protein